MKGSSKGRYDETFAGEDAITVNALDESRVIFEGLIQILGEI